MEWSTAAPASIHAPENPAPLAVAASAPNATKQRRYPARGRMPRWWAKAVCVWNPAFHRNRLMFRPTFRPRSDTDRVGPLGRSPPPTALRWLARDRITNSVLRIPAAPTPREPRRRPREPHRDARDRADRCRAGRAGRSAAGADARTAARGAVRLPQHPRPLARRCEIPGGKTAERLRIGVKRTGRRRLDQNDHRSSVDDPRGAGVARLRDNPFTGRLGGNGGRPGAGVHGPMAGSPVAGTAALGTPGLSRGHMEVGAAAGPMGDDRDGRADDGLGRARRRTARPRPALDGSRRREPAADGLGLLGQPRDAPGRHPLVLEPGAVVVLRPRGRVGARRRRPHDDVRSGLREGTADGRPCRCRTAGAWAATTGSSSGRWRP